MPGTPDTAGTLGTSDTPLEHPHSASEVAVAAALDTDPQDGLTQQDAVRRQAQWGFNELYLAPPPSSLRLVVRQFESPLVALLAAGAVIAAVIGEPKDALVIMAVLVANAAIGAVQEYRAEHALAALREMTPARANVVRDGAPRDLPARDIVPGDVVLLRSGDVVPADGRLMDTATLFVDESILTGESVPVEKDHATRPPHEAPVADRPTMVFQGTAVTGGRGRVVVTGTGEQTEVGRLARAVTSNAPPLTPLQKQFAWLTRTLSLLAVGACVVVFALGLLRHEPLSGMVLVAISLAVAAVPEALPAVQTIVLALGVQRMAQRKAIVRRLPAVEVLGATTIICTDKTGTLTLGQMRVASIWANGGSVRPLPSPSALPTAPESSREALLDLLTAAVLCNDAHLDPAPLGDPTEQALLLAARDMGVEQDGTQAAWPRLMELPFSSERRRMATVHLPATGSAVDLPQDSDNGSAAQAAPALVCVKGAPEQVLPHCRAMRLDGADLPLDASDRDRAGAAVHAMASQGLRTIAIATRSIHPALLRPEPGAGATPGVASLLERDLTLLGVFGLLDPPRPEVPGALALAHGAGIRTVMITGDHPATAAAIAAQLALPVHHMVSGADLAAMDAPALAASVRDVSVYARVTPEQKVSIVQALQRGGDVVAMTGDGANDAPALRLADIGVAMGIRGTAVAKEAAAMVLADDHYATIVTAVQEGRTIYSNLRKAVLYLLSGNLGEVLVVAVAMLLGWPLPLQPIHILWVNLVTDALPAVGLGMEPPEPGIMAHPPRQPGEVFLPRWTVPLIAVPSFLVAASTLFAFRVAEVRSGGDLVTAQSAALATLIMTHLAIGWAQRATHASSLRLSPFSNPLLLVAVVGGSLAMVPLLSWSVFQDLFRTHALDRVEWLLAVGVATLPLLGTELVKLIQRRVTQRRLTQTHDATSAPDVGATPQ